MPREETLAARIAALSPHWDLLFPPRAPPFPVVIQLHGCGGKKPFQRTWAEVAMRAGAAVLVVDSLKPRNITQAAAYASVCTGLRLPGKERAGDLFAAIAYVQSQDWARKDAIAAAGWSHGGWTIADALRMKDAAEMRRATGLVDLAGEPLAALRSIFLVYPYLGPGTLMERRWRRTPRILAILAGRDPLAGGPLPRRALAQARVQGADVTIETFPQAMHAFDEAEAAISFVTHDAALTARAHHLYARFVGQLADEA